MVIDTHILFTFFICIFFFDKIEPHQGEEAAVVINMQTTLKQIA